MILGPDGKPIEVEPCPLKPKPDPYEASAFRIIMMRNAGFYCDDDEYDDEG